MPSSGGIFSTPGSNPCLLHPLHWQAGSLLPASPGSLTVCLYFTFSYS